MMTDFVKFKEAMLDNKRAFGSAGKQDKVEGWGVMMSTEGVKYYERFRAEDPTDPESGWNKVITFSKYGNNLTGIVYSKKIDEFRTDWARVEITYGDISMEDWSKCYSDWEGLIKGDP
jgi:hypothetical protein